MAKSDVDRITDEKVARGGVLVKMYFDMRHSEKEKLQPLMTDLVNERLMKEPGIVYCYGAIEEPLEKDGMSITSAILTVLFEGIVPLSNIALKYAPAGIEVLRPAKEIIVKSSELQSMVMNLSDMSMTYSRYILENVLKPEDVKNVTEHLNDRAELGKKILDNRKKDGEEKK